MRKKIEVGIILFYLISLAHISFFQNNVDYLTRRTVVYGILDSTLEMTSIVLFFPAALLAIKYATLFILKLIKKEYLGDYIWHSAVIFLIMLVLGGGLLSLVGMVLDNISVSARLEWQDVLFYSIPLLVYAGVSYWIRIIKKSNMKVAFVIDLMFFSALWIFFAYTLLNYEFVKIL